MKSHYFLILAAFVSHYFTPRHNARIRFLIFQIQMLRNRVSALRITPTPAERAELIRPGRACGHDIKGILLVVQPQTYRRWIGAKTPSRQKDPRGRPGTNPELVRLIVSMASRNRSWGYKRIWGELRKLGFHAGLTTIRDILRRENILIPPGKSKTFPAIPWSVFINAHMQSLVAVDFFTKKIYSLGGVRDAYVLVFLHLGSRRVFASHPTFHPDGQWVMQQALDVAGGHQRQASVFDP